MTDAQVLYEGPKFRVLRRSVQDRSGKSRPFDLIAHPGAAVILPILDDGRVVLIACRRPAVGRELFELPAGTLDPPETPLDCARRETIEETGYTPGKLEPLLSFYSTPGICDEHMHAFVATDLSPGETNHEPLEFIRVVPMPFDEALRRIEDGEIMDGKTIVTLLYYQRVVRERGRG